MSQEIESFSCFCTRFSCNCLTEEQLENEIYQLHINNEFTICKNKDHEKWGNQRTWYKVTRKPTWIDNCLVPCTGEKQEKLLKLSKMLNLHCFCKGSKQVCTYCRRLMFGKEKLVFDTESWSLERIWKLEPYIDWSLVSLDN